MRILRHRPAQAFQQPALAQGGIEQVGSPQHMGNVFIRIVQGAGQLIPEQAVATTNDKGATVTVQVVGDDPLNTILVAQLPVGNLQADGGIVGGGTAALMPGWL